MAISLPDLLAEPTTSTGAVPKRDKTFEKPEVDFRIPLKKHDSDVSVRKGCKAPPSSPRRKCRNRIGFRRCSTRNGRSKGGKTRWIRLTNVMAEPEKGVVLIHLEPSSSQQKPAILESETQPEKPPNENSGDLVLPEIRKTLEQMEQWQQKQNERLLALETNVIETVRTESQTSTTVITILQIVLMLVTMGIFAFWVICLPNETSVAFLNREANFTKCKCPDDGLAPPT